jgi:hypothetical protein
MTTPTSAQNLPTPQEASSMSNSNESFSDQVAWDLGCCLLSLPWGAFAGVSRCWATHSQRNRKRRCARSVCPVIEAESRHPDATLLGCSPTTGVIRAMGLTRLPRLRGVQTGGVRPHYGPIADRLRGISEHKEPSIARELLMSYKDLL